MQDELVSPKPWLTHKLDYILEMQRLSIVHCFVDCRCAISMELDHSKCQSVLTVLGHGWHLWKHLDDHDDVDDDFSEGNCLREMVGICMSSKAAFRLACKTFRNVTYPLITKVDRLKLGWTEEDAKLEHSTLPPEWVDFTDGMPTWPKSQQLQQCRVAAFLQRLSNLFELRIDVSRGGMSQLVYLLATSWYSPSLQKLHLTSSCSM